MGAIERTELVSVEDYLSEELDGTVKHEYVGGVVYAMTGARNRHNVIALNIGAGLVTRLRGKPCRPFPADTKLRLRFPSHIRFYYPDASVSCHPNPQDDPFQDAPIVIFEVLSRSTRRVDLGEKKDAYLTIPSLDAYVIVEQDSPTLIVFRRRTEMFVREVVCGLDAALPLPEIGLTLPLAEIYDSVELVPEADEEEA